MLAEQVARSLVQRAQELFDARVFVDAKQLAVEALVKSPKGAAADQARFLIKSINQQLGITEEVEPRVDLTPIEDPTKVKAPVVPVAPEGVPERTSRITAGVHSGLYLGLLGATVGSFLTPDDAAGGAIPVGIGAGVAAGVYLPKLLDRLKWNEAQTRTAGAGTVWGGVLGGLFADLGKKEGTTSREVLVVSSIGAVGGLTLGMLMQPAESEAYSLNAAVSATGGVIAGLVAAPQTNTTPRRMLRVAGTSALGGAVPFLLYAGIHDPSKTRDERIVGALSSAGLVVGAWVGFRLTRNVDRGRDVLPGARSSHPEDAPPALLGRNSDGRWSLGSVSLSPLSRRLAPQRGMALSLIGGRW